MLLMVWTHHDVVWVDWGGDKLWRVYYNSGVNITD